MTLNFKIATAWNELNEFQRKKISDLVFSSKNNETGIYLAILFYLFCPKGANIRNAKKDVLKFIYFILQVPKRYWLKYMDFIFKELNLHKFPKYVKVDGKKYYGPADRLSNVSIDELNFAYKFYYDWMTTKDPSALDRLVTVLYRPARKKKRGDIREYFDKENIVGRGSVFPKLSMEEKIAIGFAFKGSVDYMFAKFPVLFPKQPTQSDKKPKYQSLVPMINAMFMYENQPLGSRKDVIKTNAYVFFDVAQETVIANKKRESELKKKR